MREREHARVRATYQAQESGCSSVCVRVCVCNNKGNFAKVQMPPHCDSAFYYYYTHFIEKKYTQKASVAVTVAADADATL